MAQRKQFLRHDSNPSLVTGTGFQVSEGIVRLIAYGLGAREQIGIEMRLYANGDEHWTPYAPCNGQLALTSTNTVIRIADTGEYRLASASTVNPTIVLLQEDEAGADAKVVYSVPVSACLPEAGGGTTHPPLEVQTGNFFFDPITQYLEIPESHPPLSLNIVSGALISLDIASQTLTVSNDPVTPSHLPLSVTQGPFAFNPTTQTLVIPDVDIITRVNVPSLGYSGVNDRIVYKQGSPAVERSFPFPSKWVKSQLLKPLGVESLGVPVTLSTRIFILGNSNSGVSPRSFITLYVNGVAYHTPTASQIGGPIYTPYFTLNFFSTFAPNIYEYSITWLNSVFTLDDSDYIEIQYNTITA